VVDGVSVVPQLLSRGSLARRKSAWYGAESSVSPLSMESRHRAARNRDTLPRPLNRHDDTSSLATLSASDVIMPCLAADVRLDLSTDSLEVAVMSYSYGDAVTLDEGW